MPGTLTHSPADVVRQLLINLGLGLEAGSVGDWPVHTGNEPDAPDNAITVYDTAGRLNGREMIGGEVQEHHGIQVRVRAATHPVGYARSRLIATALDTQVYQETVLLNAQPYLVHSFSRTSDVLAIGKETPTSKRVIFTVNGVVSIRQLV